MMPSQPRACAAVAVGQLQRKSCLAVQRARTVRASVKHIQAPRAREQQPRRNHLAPRRDEHRRHDELRPARIAELPALPPILRSTTVYAARVSRGATRQSHRPSQQQQDDVPSRPARARMPLPPHTPLPPKRSSPLRNNTHTHAKHTTRHCPVSSMRRQFGCFHNPLRCFADGPSSSTALTRLAPGNCTRQCRSAAFRVSQGGLFAASAAAAAAGSKIGRANTELPSPAS
eukprot:COSAG02_NODE_14534_length_1261_cov_1.561962_2_plen_230_part_00